MIRFQWLLLERLWVIWHQLFCSEVSLSSIAHVFDVELELWQVLHISSTMTTYYDPWPWWGDPWSDERGGEHLSAGCQCRRNGKGRGRSICSHYIHVGPSRWPEMHKPLTVVSNAWFHHAYTNILAFGYFTSLYFTVLLNAAVSTRLPNYLKQKDYFGQHTRKVDTAVCCFLIYPVWPNFKPELHVQYTSTD